MHKLAMPQATKDPAQLVQESGALPTRPLTRQRCRFCNTNSLHSFVDLGMSPLCESYRSAEQQDEMEPFYPLHAYVCGRCFLVQLPQYVTAAHIFEEYAYFSSYSTSWLRHAEQYVATVTERYQLNEQSQVIEVASNDGYLLQYFVQRGIPCLGIEPAANVARAAQERGVPSCVKFFGEATARELVAAGQQADLLLGNNVLAHVPDLNDFVRGLKILLAPRGVLTLEFPHLERLIAERQFDTIYHEHFCYFSFTAVRTVLAAQGLEIFDVEELASHGGSLRLHVKHGEDDSRPIAESVPALLVREETAGVRDLESYRRFGEQVAEVKRSLLKFLIEAREAGKTVVGYGAPGKGNTLLNYCGIRGDMLAYTVDRNPYKQGKFLPGSGIAIHAPEAIDRTRPDYVLILPWNLKREIIAQLEHIRAWGGKFVVPIPTVEVL